MSSGAEQKMEIESIKPRQITVNLSDADMHRLCMKAGAADITVSQLLENFIGDLVDGTYSNGADERSFVENWYGRCWFGLFPERTFLRYLIEHHNLHDFRGWLEDREDAKNNIKITQEEIEMGVLSVRDNNCTWEDIIKCDGSHGLASYEQWKLEQLDFIEQEKELLEYAEDEINEIWTDFLSWTDKTEVKIEDETKKVSEWYEQYQRVLKESYGNIV